MQDHIRADSSALLIRILFEHLCRKDKEIFIYREDEEFHATAHKLGHGAEFQTNNICLEIWTPPLHHQEVQADEESVVEVEFGGPGQGVKVTNQLLVVRKNVRS